jgi:dTDP-4-dehydrorhamnose 3,5-epimerase-like enzyme
MAQDTAPRGPQMPQHGLIRGGVLHGWRYGILRCVRLDEKEYAMDVRATPPHWPFPVEVRLTNRDKCQLRAVPGERAKRLGVASLMANAEVIS